MEEYTDYCSKNLWSYLCEKPLKDPPEKDISNRMNSSFHKLVHYGGLKDCYIHTKLSKSFLSTQLPIHTNNS